MTTTRKAEECRVCGNDLRGNQRRWLFAAHKRTGGKNLSPTRSFSRETASTLSPSRSSQSSPWGSMLSLGSSHSHKSQTLLTMNKGTDVLAVLTHILGQPIPQGNGLGEFICGKCVSVLERVFKFDTVIARVEILSKERLQKLAQERDGLSKWMRRLYMQRHPSYLRNRGSSSEDDVDLVEGGIPEDSGKVYHDMLNDNMALAAYEFWSEKADMCPYYKSTGKRCSKSKNCDCCDSLRVSDSDYESVCGIPRHLPEPSSLGLSRDKSQSMPLHWSGAPQFRSSPALSGSCHLLQEQRRKASTQSMDSLDGQDPFDSSEEDPVIWNSILKRLKSIEGRPVRSPTGSRIPVLAKGQNESITAGSSTSRLVQMLDFVEEDGVNGESEDVLTELGDEFLPLHREVTTARVNLVRQLREQLDQAHSRIRSLEAGLQDTNQTDTSDTSLSRPSPPLHLNGTLEGEGTLIHNLSNSLKSREKVIQECVGLIQSLCVELGSGLEEADKLISKVTVSLTDTHSDREGVLEAEVLELKEKETSLQKELQALQEASRGQERDLFTLNTVLQSNQDIINDLRVELAEKTKSLQDMQKEKELWKEQEVALDVMLQEKDVLLSRLEEALESAHKDVQVLSDPVSNQWLSAGEAEATLADQVREKESLLLSCFKDWKMHTANEKKEFTKVYTALENYDAVIQDQKQSHKQAITELSEQLRAVRGELRETIRNAKQTEQYWKTERAKSDLEERRLRECLLKRDKLIEQVLLDAEKRDGMLMELHQSFSSKAEPRIGVQHTL